MRYCWCISLVLTFDLCITSDCSQSTVEESIDIDETSETIDESTDAIQYYTSLTSSDLQSLQNSAAGFEGKHVYQFVREGDLDQNQQCKTLCFQ